MKRAQCRSAPAQASSDNSAAVADLKRSTSDQYADLNSQLSAASTGINRATVGNGRLQISTPDDRFSAALRTLIQYDTAIYSQTSAAKSLPASYAPGLSSGSNFRRIYLGLSGTACSATGPTTSIYDFGGSGVDEERLHLLRLSAI